MRNRWCAGNLRTRVRREQIVKHAPHFLLIGATALASSVAAWAQQAPVIQFPSSHISTVTVAPFDASRFPIFKDLFTGHRVGLQPVSFVLINNSDKPIVGIEVQWTTTDASGREQSSFFESDSLRSPTEWPVADAHDNLLVAQDLFLSESTLKRINPGAGHGGIIGSFGSDFSDAVRIGISIDCLIFADGEVVGPNQHGLTDEIAEAFQQRVDAANAVVQKVQSALQAGQDPAKVLSPMLDVAPDRIGTMSYRECQFAQEILHSSDIHATLQKIQNVPPLRKFHRSDGRPV
jgi:hypothetical protein